MKWIIDFNMRDGYIKYISFDITFIMTKHNDHWHVVILNTNIEFEYYGNHYTYSVIDEVLRRIKDI